MGRWLVAALVAVALAGCSLVAAPEPGLSDSERELWQQQLRHSYWSITGLPEDQRPPDVPMIEVAGEEWSARFVECMNEAGYDNYQEESGGYMSFTVEGQDPEAESLSVYLCSTKYWTDNGIYNVSQMNYLYDYYQQQLVPCLEVNDAPIWGTPDREKFIQDGGWWHPYFNFKKAEQERIYADSSLPIKCPPMPPGVDDPGYWDWWSPPPPQ